MLSRELTEGYLDMRQSQTAYQRSTDELAASPGRFALCLTAFEQIARLSQRALLSAYLELMWSARDLVTRWLPRSS
jgi:hypothetical protein